MYDFSVARPKTLADAKALLEDEEAQPLAGGQTLIPTLKQRLAMPETLVSLTGIPELQGVCRNDAGQIVIGAATTHADVAAATRSDFPALADLAGHIGDPAVRNRGTIGGSLANNDPAACYPAAALGTGAMIRTDRREIAADAFFDGLFGTALADGEIITAVTFPVPVRAQYIKFVQPASRFALVGVFVAQYAQAVRVAVTGASEDGVYRWSAAETALSETFDPAAVKALESPAAGMISDLHGDAPYRAHLVQEMTCRAVTKCLEGATVA